MDTYKMNTNMDCIRHNIHGDIYSREGRNVNCIRERNMGHFKFICNSLFFKTSEANITY